LPVLLLSVAGPSSSVEEQAAIVTDNRATKPSLKTLLICIKTPRV
jgi:hypothetical protein